MTRRRPTASDKETVARRAHGDCEYCKSRADYSPDTFSIEHVVPVARGGSHELSNLALSCQGCNGGSSSASMPETRSVVNERRSFILGRTVGAISSHGTKTTRW